ncbi:MAG: PIN domain-containing protein [Ilumatobacter sp.]|uniref:PIN domain-containing protein n=1 Tax=Ilumatobacter sp. TaxID=1967498 RepID=UPI00391BD2BB
MNSSAAGRAVVDDTMAASALINSRRRPGEPNPFEKLIAGRRVVISFATVTELRCRAINGNWGELRQRSLERNLRTFVVVQPDDKLMSTCAEFRSACERRGHPLGQKLHEADRWIAVTAIAGGLDLVSDDKAFRSAPGLSLLSTRTA